MQNPYVMRGFVSPSASKIAHSIPRRPDIIINELSVHAKTHDRPVQELTTP
jgi:hypothetical protein